MNIFNQKEQNYKKVLLLIILVLFILGWLISEKWQIADLWQQLLLFIFSYGLGIFFMLGDEKYLQKIYSNELEKKILITRNPLFLLVLPFLSLFMLTSTGNIPGIALVIGMNAVLLIEIWQLADKREAFNKYFLNRVENKISLSEIKIFKIGFSIYFLFLLLLLR